MVEHPFETNAAEYDAWYDANPNAFSAEVAAIECVLPMHRGRWVEIGVGSGRFAEALGIPIGIEPAYAMAQLARARGINVLSGTAESLPLATGSVDAAFLITALCFIADPAVAFAEVERVLKPGGCLIAGFLPLDSPLGESVARTADTNAFFAHARLRTRAALCSSLTNSGFSIDARRNTLHGNPDTFDAYVHEAREGSDGGSFVVVRAQLIQPGVQGVS